MDFADLRGADLTGAALDTVESIRGADFTGAQGLETLRSNLLGRDMRELDCWNPLTRSTTRDSLA